MSNCYQASGRFNASGLITMPLFGLLIGLIAAVIYPFVTWLMPLVYVNALIVLGFGFAIGAGVGLGVKKSRVRNGKMAVLFALVVAFICQVVAWLIWLTIVCNEFDIIDPEIFGEPDITILGASSGVKQVLFLAQTPSLLLDLVKDVNEIGVWTFKKNVVNGTFLTIVWAIEALAIFILAGVSASGAANAPFSETCEEWLPSQDLAPVLLNDPQGFKAAVDNGDISYLFNAEPAADVKAQDHLAVQLYEGQPGEPSYISIKSTVYKDEKKKKSDTSSVVDYLEISYDQAQKLVQKFPK